MAIQQSAPVPRTILFYADPPYTDNSRKYVGQYIHDDFNHFEFLKVITTAPSFCKFAVSGYDDELYNTMLSDWHRVEVETLATVKYNASKGSKRTEVFWRNYELNETARLL